VISANRRRWIPLTSIGLAYAGFVVGLGLILILTTPEYEHATELHLGLAALAWSLLALVCVGVSTASLLLFFNQGRPWLGWVTAALNVVVVVGMAAALQFSISSLQNYTAGLAAYETAVQVCGHAPVLASAGWGGDVLIPSDPDYERLKYSTQDHLLLGTPKYFCTLADAEARGFQRAPWHSPAP
jgi:hypothetical protein